MRPRLLVDSSSLVKALKLGRLEPLAGQAIQWLTPYEVLNALWKEARLVGSLSIEEALFLQEILSEVMGQMEVLAPIGLEREVLEYALSHRISVYDASYVVVAERMGLALVTEDSRLSEAARNRVSVLSFDDLV